MEYIPAKTILSGFREHNPWFGINYNMNIYRGCCYGCIYCDSRSECYRVEEFDRVRAKQDALSKIQRELHSKRKKGVLGTGAMSDPYNPFEGQMNLTRGALQLIDAHGFGASICTKSDLVTRDIDLLRSIKKHSPVLVKITVTSAADTLCAEIEPNAPVSSKRFAAIKAMADSGIFAGVLLMPVLPFIQDNEQNICEIIHMAGVAGAKFIYPAFGVTLRQNQRDFFFKKLDKSFPGLKEKYIEYFGNAYSCVSPGANRLYRLLARECGQRSILYKMEDIISAYRGDDQKQLKFF